LPSFHVLKNALQQHYCRAKFDQLLVRNVT
jgi:hypothetical protein